MHQFGVLFCFDFIVRRNTSLLRFVSSSFMQVIIVYKMQTVDIGINLISLCYKNILLQMTKWMLWNNVMMNDDKTEFIVIKTLQYSVRIHVCYLL